MPTTNKDQLNVDGIIGMTDLLVILVSYNTRVLTRQALNCLFASKLGFGMAVTIIDNASSDGSADMIRTEFPNVTLIENGKNVGFGRANNQAVDAIKARYLLLLNTDAFVEPDTISKTVQYMEEHEKCGILGVRLIGRDGTLQPSCRFFPTPWNTFLQRSGLDRLIRTHSRVDDMSWDHGSVRDCDWVPGCYLLIRKEVVDRVGLFDPRYFLYYEEVDLCFAAKSAGWAVTFYPFTSVIHLGGESAKSEGEISAKGKQLAPLNIESELLYFRKNHGLSGVLSHLLLGSLADLIQFSKDIVKRRTWGAIKSNIKHSLLVWETFFRTHFASEATR